MNNHFSRNGFLTDRGYAEVAQRASLEGLLPLGVDGECDLQYIDSRVSVSGLRRDEDLSDFELDEQYQRFLNGC